MAMALTSVEGNEKGVKRGKGKGGEREPQTKVRNLLLHGETVNLSNYIINSLFLAVNRYIFSINSTRGQQTCILSPEASV